MNLVTSLRATGEVKPAANPMLSSLASDGKRGIIISTLQVESHFAPDVFQQCHQRYGFYHVHEQGPRSS
jgi:hypothetical protein